MKPFWFAFNVTDWLSSKSVRMMSLAERGAYIGLLATAWGEDVPGTLPVADELVRRLSEMPPAEWAISGPILLAEFPISECGTFRYNPRLREEHAKQMVISEKNSAKGKLSAERRAAAKGQPTGSHNSTTVESEPTTVEKTATESQLVTTTITSTTDVVLREATGKQTGGMTSQKGGHPLRDHGDTPVFDAASWPSLNDPKKFAALCANLDFPQVDFERYRKQIIVSLGELQLPATSLRNWIKSYLNNDKDAGSLLVPVAQTPNERPSNYHSNEPYVPQPGNRIPDMSSVMNPNWKPPQG